MNVVRAKGKSAEMQHTSTPEVKNSANQIVQIISQRYKYVVLNLVLLFILRLNCLKHFIEANKSGRYSNRFGI